MGLTYFGGETLLNYLYNDNDQLDGYDSFEIQLIRSNGTTPYNSQSGAASDLAAVNRDSGGWNIANQFVKNANDLTFPPSNNPDSQSIVFFNVYVSGISKPLKLFATGELNTPININQGETPIIDAEDLEIRIDINSLYTAAFREKIYQYLFLGQDSLSSVINYRFNIIDTQGAQQPLEFTLGRDLNFPIWQITQISDYAQASNMSDVIFNLNTFGSITTNLIRMFYGEGTFPNETYTSAGVFAITTTNGTSQITTTIANGETARLQTGQLRINAK